MLGDFKEKAGAHLKVNGHEYTYPIYEATDGHDVIDMRKLFSDTGLFSYDPGFTSTAHCQSEICIVDGEKGALRYRGYAIEDLAAHKTYLQVCYLLLNGALPSESDDIEFVKEIKAVQGLDNDIKAVIEAFPREAHPMAVLGGAVYGLAGLYHKDINLADKNSRRQVITKIVAQMPVLSACIGRKFLGLDPVCEDSTLSYGANFMYMFTGKPVSKTVEKAMDCIFTLHAEHEQNASTATVRLAGSSGTDPFAALSAGIATLWGPAHGGANEAVLKMLSEIGDESRVGEFVNKAKDKNDSFRLMGFGHRVYKNYDPRARIMQKLCREVLQELNVQDPLLKIAQQLEKIALEDPYFIEKKLYPNVDFYSGIILKALGFPTEMFTVLFALARSIGWMCQWNEAFDDVHAKIGRPRQLFVGFGPRQL